MATTIDATTIDGLTELLGESWFLVFAIPIFGAFLSVFIGKINTLIRKYFSIATIGISAGLAGLLVSTPKNDWQEYVIQLMPAKSAAGKVFFLTSINVDPLGAFVALVAAGLGFLIAVFSLEYMKDDEAETRYWFFIQLFVGGMVLLVLAGDLVSLYFGWKIVGVCSYFLIAHWYHKPDPQGTLCARSGIKAFLMTLVGDIALLGGLGILWMELGTINILRIANQFSQVSSSNQPIIAVLIFLGAIGKSAQFPLITWLSSPRKINIDAMQGPTTVSALIHAATMVKAGVYLMSRFYFVFAPADVEVFLITIAFVAAITAFIAAASAMVAIDIKRVLAYSTVSQLAYMFMGLAIGYLAYNDELEVSIEGFMGTQFHLMNHAVFKALLFLSAGAIINSLHHERNIKKMGGLRRDLPILHITMFIGVLGLAGVLVGGFFSKEAILGSAIEFADSGSDLAFFGWIIYLSGIITTFMTAMYSFRFFFLIFYGEKPEELKIETPGLIMRGITAILAVLVLITGFLGPLFLNDYFEPMFGHFEHEPLHFIPEDIALINFIIAVLLIIIGIVISFFLYYDDRPRTVMPIVRKNPLFNACYILAREGFYLDTIYQGLTDLFLWADWKLRKLQTGDLNYNMSLLGLVGLTVVLVLLVF
ncbi:MAG: NADH-quinone oxidoreductase subunit L [Promethearchaeota archaeon]